MSKIAEPTGATYGNAGMHRLLIRLLRLIPVRVFYGIMYVFVVPVSMVVSSGARLTYRYFRQKRGYGRWRALVDTYRNHCIFGQTVIDKFAMYAGHKFRIRYHGFDLYQQKCSEPQSIVLLNAHIGCSEILGYSMNQTKPCNVMVYGGEKQNLMAYRAASFGESNIKMIPVGTGGSHSEEILSALEKGEIVCAFADRFANQRQVVVSSIFGHQVNLAKTPFSLAIAGRSDVFMVSAMKEKDGGYTAFFTPLQYDHTLPMNKQRQQLADGYTAEIERLLNIYPLQWFNYSDLWVDQLFAEK